MNGWLGAISQLACRPPPVARHGRRASAGRSACARPGNRDVASDLLLNCVEMIFKNRNKTLNFPPDPSVPACPKAVSLGLDRSDQILSSRHKVSQAHAVRIRDGRRNEIQRFPHSGKDCRINLVGLCQLSRRPRKFARLPRVHTYETGLGFDQGIDQWPLITT